MKINIWGLLVIFLIGYFLYMVKEDVAKNRDLSRQQRSMELKLEEIKLKNSSAMDLLSRINNDFYIEREARSRLGLVKKGEIVYQICR